MASAKREVTHRELFEQVGRLQGSMRERYKYDVKRDKAEDAYRKKMLAKVTTMETSIKKLDGLPKRVATLETALSNFNMLKKFGVWGWFTIRGIAIAAIAVVIVMGAGFSNGITILAKWFMGH